MEGFQVGRTLSADYILLINGAALAFQIFLLARRRWAELAVFNAAAAFNILMEIIMIGGGTRHFEPDGLAQRIGAVACLAWSDNGLFATIAFINIRQWAQGGYSKRMIVGANLFYFIGLPLLSINYGLLEGSVRTWRVMAGGTEWIEIAFLLLLASKVWRLGFRGLLKKMLAVGLVMDAAFEARLFLFGVRPLEGADWPAAIVRIFCEFNVAICLGFLIIRRFYNLDRLKDAAQAKTSAVGKKVKKK